MICWGIGDHANQGSGFLHGLLGHWHLYYWLAAAADTGKRTCDTVHVVMALFATAITTNRMLFRRDATEMCTEHAKMHSQCLTTAIHMLQISLRRRLMDCRLLRLVGSGNDTAHPRPSRMEPFLSAVACEGYRCASRRNWRARRNPAA